MAQWDIVLGRRRKSERRKSERRKSEAREQAMLRAAGAAVRRAEAKARSSSVSPPPRSPSPSAFPGLAAPHIPPPPPRQPPLAPLNSQSQPELGHAQQQRAGQRRHAGGLSLAPIGVYTPPANDRATSSPEPAHERLPSLPRSQTQGAHLGAAGQRGPFVTPPARRDWVGFLSAGNVGGFPMPRVLTDP